MSGSQDRAQIKALSDAIVTGLSKQLGPISQSTAANMDIEGLQDSIGKLTKGLMKSGVSGSKLDKAISNISDSIRDLNNEVSVSRKSLGQLDDNVKDLNDAVEEFTDAASTSAGVVGEISEDLRQQNKDKALQKFNEALNKSSGFTRELTDKLDRLGSGSVVAQSRMLDRLTKTGGDVDKRYDKVVRASSLFSASLLKNHENLDTGSAEYLDYVQALSKSAGRLDKSFLKKAGVLDEASNEISSNLDARDFAKLRLNLGEAQEAIAKSVSDLGVTSLGDILGSDERLLKAINAEAGLVGGAGEKARASIIALAARLEKQGFEFTQSILDKQGNITEEAAQRLLKDDELKKLAEDLRGLDAKINGSAKEMDALGKRANDLRGAFSATVAEWKKKVSDLAASSAIIASFGAALSHFKDVVVQDFQAFNKANLAGSFAEVEAASFRLGMSVKETVEFLNANKRLVAIQGGAGNFEQTTKDVYGSFKQFGYSLKDAAGMMAPIVDQALSEGVNVKDSNSLNEFIAKTADSFKDINAITNLTLGQYAELNKELMESHDVQSVLIGLSQKQAKAYADGLISQRNEYIAQGLSTKAAQELVQAQQAQKRELVTNRLREAAKSMVLGHLAGMSAEDSQRLTQLKIKGASRTEDEDKEFTALQGQMTQKVSEYRNQAYANDSSGLQGAVVDILADKLGFNEASNAKKVGEGGTQMQMAQRSGTAMTKDESREKSKQIAAQPGKEAGADAENLSNSFESIKNNSLTKALLAFGAGLLGSTLQLAAFARNLGKANGSLGGQGLLSDLLGGGRGGGKIGGKPIKGGRFGRWGAKVFGMGALIEGASLATEAAHAAGGVGAEGVAAEASAVSKMSAMGKMAKSALGGPATKVLGAAGTAVDLGIRGVETYNEFGQIDEEKKAGKITEAQANIKKDTSAGKLVGGAAGAAAGGWGGAAIGAAIGTAILPGIGTVVGGLLGGALGAWGGDKAGTAVGEFGGRKIGEALNAPKATPVQKPQTAVDRAAMPAPAANTQVTAVATPVTAQTVATTPAVDTVAQKVPSVSSTPAAGQTADSVNKTARSNQDQTNSRTKTEETTLSVSDQNAQDKLTQIAESMATAVQVLQTLASQGVDLQAIMANANASPIVSMPKQIPSGFSFMTGRTA